MTDNRTPASPDTPLDDHLRAAERREAAAREGRAANPPAQPDSGLVER